MRVQLPSAFLTVSLIITVRTILLLYLVYKTLKMLENVSILVEPISKCNFWLQLSMKTPILIVLHPTVHVKR